MKLPLRVGREDAPPFSELDRFLVHLLQPQLQPLLVRTMRSVVAAAAPPLTERQREILALVRAGMTNQQVARQLGIPAGTVRKHLETSYGRLHVQSRVAAAGAASFDGAEAAELTAAAR